VAELAAVVGAGALGLGCARALAEAGFEVTVYERYHVGHPLGGSPGRTRICRRTYDDARYVRLARRALEEWHRLDPRVVVPTGLVETGHGVHAVTAAMDACQEPYEVFEPAEARRRFFPEATFSSPVLWDRDAGAVLADRALRAMARGLDIRENTPVDEPRELVADVVVLCPGAWLGKLTALPVAGQIEQVSYFAPPAGDRPAFIDWGDAPGEPAFFGVPTPGVGYKLAEDWGRPGPWDAERADRPVDDGVVDRLVQYVRRRFPGLDPAPLASEACLYAVTGDRNFILDRLDGLYVCGGDSGHAFKFAPLLGRLMAELVVTGELPAEAAMFGVGRLAH
jgi:sarcosine oxidase